MELMQHGSHCSCQIRRDPLLDNAQVQRKGLTRGSNTRQRWFRYSNVPRSRMMWYFPLGSAPASFRSITTSVCPAFDMMSLARITLMATSGKAVPTTGSGLPFSSTGFLSLALKTVEKTPLPCVANTSYLSFIISPTCTNDNESSEQDWIAMACRSLSAFAITSIDNLSQRYAVREIGKIWKLSFAAWLGKTARSTTDQTILVDPNEGGEYQSRCLPGSCSIPQSHRNYPGAPFWAQSGLLQEQPQERLQTCRQLSRH